MTTFEELVRNQFTVAGTGKYRHSVDKEVTDILTTDFGHEGLLWCIGKYTYRFNNEKREKDLLKIATYMFIAWLKDGFHLEGISTVNPRMGVCTTVEAKNTYYPGFCERLLRYEKEKFGMAYGMPTRAIYDLLKVMAVKRDQELNFHIFLICKELWKMSGFHLLEEHEQDLDYKGRKAN